MISEIDRTNRETTDTAAENRRQRLGRLAALSPYDSKFAVGLWYFTGTFNDVNPEGDPRVTESGSSITAGIAVNGAFPFRPNDQSGLGTAIARTARHYSGLQGRLGRSTAPTETGDRADAPDGAERFAALQIGIQYVRRPNANPSIPGVLLGQMRFEITP